MTVLDRSELQASPLADLHLLADQIGLEGFRRMRKADLIDAILGEASSEASSASSASSEAPRDASSEAHDHKGRARPARARSGAAERTAEGVVEVLGNGSAFLRVGGPEPSDEDVYISAAQVRRCELVSGDRVAGPVRSPRRSERYPSLVRVATVNDEAADAGSRGVRYDDLPCAWPSERIELGSEDATLAAIDRLTPLGRGSRAVIVGPARSGKSETLRGILAALDGRDGLGLTVVLAGVRPEEIADWREPVAPVAALSFAASPDAQGQAVESAVESAKRAASRGGDTVVLIDGLDGLHPHTARSALAAARNLAEAGSVTVIATATRPYGGETTVIALEGAGAAGAGEDPKLDAAASGTLKAELLS
jgi:transcription termination factor Rho